MQDYLKKIFSNPVFIIALAGLMMRIIFTLIFVDLSKDYYWEYGDIANYLLHGKGYSFIFLIGDQYAAGYQTQFPAYPSAFMPPGYVYYMIPFLLLKQIILRNILFYTVQHILSCFVIVYLYKLTENLFSRKTAIISAMIYALLPEFIYASNLPGPTIIYHLGVIITFLILFKNDYSKKNIVILALVSGLMIYFRSEFAVFALIIAVLIVFRKKYKFALYFVLIIEFMLLPWQIRNYLVFDSIIPLTTNSGLNLYKGHNPAGIYIGRLDEYPEFRKIIETMRGSPRLEVELSKSLQAAAIKEIRNQPGREFASSLTKIYHLWLYFPSDQRSGNPAYLYPWFLLLFFSCIGLWVHCSPRKYYFIYLFLFYHSLVAVVFFVLPRYQTLMKIALLPFAAAGLIIVFEYFFRRKKP